MGHDVYVTIVYGFYLKCENLNEDIQGKLQDYSCDSDDETDKLYNKIHVFDAIGCETGNFFGMKFDIKHISGTFKYGGCNMYEIPDTNKLLEEFFKRTTQNEREFFLEVSTFCSPPQFMIM